MTPSIFQLKLTVPESAIDSLGHVNNVTYLHWVQNIAEKHWTTKASDTLQKQVYWIVLNHFITYKNPAYADELLLLSTWVERLEGVKSERHTEIRRQNDKTLLVKAETLWCLMDAGHKRPKRITPAIKAIF